MADVLYTTTDQIRAVMGFTEVNLPDKTLVDHDLATLIEIELDLVYSAHAVAIAAAESTPTTAELKLGNRIRLFCAYQGAVFTLPGLQMIAAQKMTDGDAEYQLFEKDNLERTEAKLIAMRDYLAGVLNPTDYGDTAGLYNQISSAVPAYDPVTATD